MKIEDIKNDKFWKWMQENNYATSDKKMIIDTISFECIPFNNLTIIGFLMEYGAIHYTSNEKEYKEASPNVDLLNTLLIALSEEEKSRKIEI